MSTFDRSNLVAAARRQWVSPAVKLVGTVAEVLKAAAASRAWPLATPGKAPASHPSPVRNSALRCYR